MVVGGGGLVITVVCVCERLDEQTPPIMMQSSMGTTTNNTKAVTDTPRAIPMTATVIRVGEMNRKLVITQEGLDNDM